MGAGEKRKADSESVCPLYLELTPGTKKKIHFRIDWTPNPDNPEK